MGEAVVGAASAAFLEVGTFVAVALAGFGLLRCRLGEGLTRWLEANRGRGPLAGALLGAFPGCGGAIVVMPLHQRGQVSYGTVVSTLTATMGDSSFVLLAADPRLAIAVHAGLLVVGAATGALVDRLGIEPRSPDPARAGPGPALGRPRPSTVGAAAAVRGLTGRPQLRTLPWTTVGFWTFTLGAFGVAVPTVLQLVPTSAFDVAGLPTTTLLGVGGAALCVAITIGSRAVRREGYGARPVAERPREVLTESAAETARITTWVVVAFVGYELLVTATGLDITMLPSIGLVGVLVGALLGLLPGCGPQLVLTGLYAQGALPLSVLAANALSQDGDALIPLLATDRRAAVLASAITVVPGLLIGAALVGLGL
ncbi:MAG: putative manganese transporter [Nitriliruptor sp.]